MSRNVMLLGGPANGQMVRVEDDATAVTVWENETVVTGPEDFLLPYNKNVSSYLYWQSETDKNVFNYAH